MDGDPLGVRMMSQDDFFLSFAFFRKQRNYTSNITINEHLSDHKLALLLLILNLSLIFYVYFVLL